MDFLHSLFEQQLEFYEDEDGTIIIGDTPFTLASILQSDQDAYQEEFRNWMNDKWLPEQNETLGKLLEIDGNKKRFEDLCAALKKDQLIPFVGSGMSIPSGLPAWPDFLRSIRKHSDFTSDDLEKLLSHYKYEEAVEKLSESMPNNLFDERIEHDLRIDDPKNICGAVLFLPKIFNKIVLTTNLDNILEEIYKDTGLGFSHKLIGNNIAEYRQVKSRAERVLLKLHGDCFSTLGRVLKRTEYDDTYSIGSNVCNELSIIFQNNNILYLGCSLQRDRTMQLFLNIVSSVQNIPRHYAFIQITKAENEKDEEKMRVRREHFLAQRNIFPIWYDEDHDKSIQAFFVGMLQSLDGF